MFKLATISPFELWTTPGIVRIIAQLLDAGAVIQFDGDGNDPKLQRHIRRLARHFHCWLGSPINSNEPLTLVRSPVGQALD